MQLVGLCVCVDLTNGFTMQLDALPADALRAIYEHVPLPFVLKRVCRALRDLSLIHI